MRLVNGYVCDCFEMGMRGILSAISSQISEKLPVDQRYQVVSTAMDDLYRPWNLWDCLIVLEDIEKMLVRRFVLEPAQLLEA